MLRPLTTLVLCQFVGEVAARALGLPLPGPVLGLLLLLVLLIVRGGPDKDMRATSGVLLRHLSLLFVPAGVGVMTQWDALRRDWGQTFVGHVDLSGEKRLGYGVAQGVARDVLGRFEAGEFDRAVIFYNRFESVISQVPTAR